MVASGTATGTAQIGVTGLAVMGRNLARNFARNGYTVAVHNRSYEKIKSLIADHGDEGDFMRSRVVEDFVAALERPRKIVIMVQAGGPTDAVIDALVPLLEQGDIIVDAGNAHYPDTRRREAALAAKGLQFVGSGVSGGEEGALLGPSIMPGGPAESYVTLGPILEKISAKVDGVPCCTHVGPDGAGHFVKMVHNGIEYADMQLIGEAYDLLRQGWGLAPAEIGHLRRVEQGRPGVLPHRDHRRGARAGGRRDRQRVRRHRATRRAEGHRPLDRAERARPWCARHGHRRGHVRPRYRLLPQRSARRSRRCRRDTPAWNIADRDAFIEDVRLALYASKVVAYAQGFDQMPPPRPSTTGTSIAARWRASGVAAASSAPASSTASPRPMSATRTSPLLLVDPYFADEIAKGVGAWRRVVSRAALSGVPVPAFGSSLSYYDCCAPSACPQP